MKIWCIYIALFFWLPIEAQNISFQENVTITDGLVDRDVVKIIRDNEGLFWLFFRFKIQIYDGQNLTSVASNTLIENDLTFYEHIFLHDGIFYANSDSLNNLLVITPTVSKDSVHMVKYSDSNKKHRIIHDKLYTLVESHVGRVLVQEKDRVLHRLDDITIDDIVFFYVLDGLFYYTDHENRLYVYDEEKRKSRMMRKDVQYIIGDHNNVLWYLNADGKIDNLANVEFPFFKGKVFGFARFKHDNKGNTILLVSESRFSNMNVLLAHHGQDRFVQWDAISKIQPYIYEVYGENFLDRCLFGTQNGFYFYILNQIFSSVLRDSANADASFPNPIMGVTYRKADNSLYIAEENGGLYQLDESNQIKKIFPSKRKPEHFAEINNNIIFDNREELILASTYEHSRFHLFAHDFKSDQNWSNPLDYYVASIYVDEDKAYCYGSRGNAADGRMSVFNTKSRKIEREHTFDQRISGFDISGDDVYLGMSTGLWKSSKENLGEDIGENLVKDVPIRHIKNYGDYTLAGTHGFGVFIFKNDSLIQHITKEVNGLCHNFVELIEQDCEGYYWLGTRGGLAILNEQFQLVKNYYPRDGITHHEFNRNTGVMLDNGTLYMGTLNGITSVDTKLAKEVLDPTMRFAIDRVGYIDDDRFIESSVIAPHASKIFLKYRFNDYRMDIKDDSWKYVYKVNSSNPRDKMTYKDDLILIENPSIGLRTISVYRNQPDGTQILTQQVNLRKENYVRYYLSYFVIVLLTIGLFLLYRKYTSRKEEHAEVMYETQISHQLDMMKMEALRSQMNPHFIFNSLTSIQYYIQTQKTELADKYLAQFGKLMRLILESSRSDHISIRDEIDLLKIYVQLENLRFEHKFEYEFFIDHTTDLDFEVPPMIIQPFIENAILHGLNHLIDRIGMLQIKFAMEREDVLICEIIDNGVGRKNSGMKRSITKKRKSQGIDMINERIALLKNSGRLTIDIRIEDPEDQNGESLGTHVTIRFQNLL